MSELGEIKVTDRFSLKGKNFLITGGGRGIGFACAKAIAQLGGGVAVIDRASAPVAEFESLGERYGVKTFYAQGDVTDQHSIEQAVSKSVSALGQLHGGLTAAGVVNDEPLSDADWERTKQTLDINILGTYWVVKLLARHLVDTKTPGSIVAISSIKWARNLCASAAKISL